MITAPRFVVSVNGQQRCVAGFDGYAVLSAGIDFVRRAEGHHSPVIEGVAHFRVGGLQRREHVDWLTEDLFVGDEVSIRVLDGGPFDPHTVQERTMPATCGSWTEDDTVRRKLDARRDRLEKIGNVIPHRFEILGNGKRFCMAGMDFGVLSMMLTWVRRDPANAAPHSEDSSEDSEGGDVDLHVGGLKNDVHLDWCNMYVDAGDEIVVRILGPGPADPPKGRHERLRIPHEEGTVVSSARRTLRRLVDDDLPFVSQLLGDPEAMKNFCKPMDAEQAKQWLARHREYPQHHRGTWIIIDNKTIKPVGLAGIVNIDVEGKVLPVVQCVIAPTHRRQRHGIDSAGTCIHMVHDPSTWTGQQSSDAFALIRPQNAAGLAIVNRLKMKQVRTVQHGGCEHLLFVAEDRGT